jgi:hypothetical protein
VPELADPPNRLDTGGHLRRPLTGAEVVDVEVAASLARKQQGRVRAVPDPLERLERPQLE